MARRRWPLARRRWPLAATAGLIVVGLVTSTWGVRLFGRADWALPDDLWRTLVAAQRLLHGNLTGLYTPPTELVSFPGAAVILVPLVAVTDAAGLSLQLPGPQNGHPGEWLLAGPYEIAIAALALFAADAIAEHLDASWPKRAVLAAAGAVALWGVTLRFGHPEDAVAVGLFLYGLLVLARSRAGRGHERGPGGLRAGRAAWLIGAAVAVQPLVLLALPLVLVVIERRQWAGFLARAAAPGALVLGIAAAANWHATVRAVTSQPNSPTVNHPTPWTALSAHLGGGMVAAGPARALAVLAACGCAVAAGRRWGTAVQGGEWSPETLARLLWWVAVALALRSVFEPVMVAYYVWPALAVALIRGLAELAAPGRGRRRGGGADVRRSASVAGPVELVAPDDRRAHPRPVAGPRPAGPGPRSATAGQGRLVTSMAWRRRFPRPRSARTDHASPCTSGRIASGRFRYNGRRP